MNIIIGFMLLCQIGDLFGLDLYEGDFCQDKKGVTGFCEHLSNCTTAIRQIQTGYYPKICGFEGLWPIVCCTSWTTETTTASSHFHQKGPGYISQTKCKEYQKYAHESNRKGPFNPFGKLRGCPKSQEFPHSAELGYYSRGEIKWLCNGAIISPNFILTAAQCLSNKLHGHPKRVRVGFAIEDKTTYLQERKIIETINYSETDFLPVYHDIGLVKLESDLVLNTYVRPACLHTDKSAPTYAITAGNTDDDKRKTLKVISDEECDKRVQDVPQFWLGILEDYMICYENEDKKTFRDICKVAYGEPIQIIKTDTSETKCMYDIVGIASFNSFCSSSTLPEVYTRVAAYVGWIENNVWPN